MTVILFGLLSFVKANPNEVGDSAQPDSVLESEVMRTIQSSFIRFRENKGQWEEKILYQSLSTNLGVFFMKDGLSFGARREERVNNDQVVGKESNGEMIRSLVWNMYFEGMNVNCSVMAEHKKENVVNYFKGNNPARYGVGVAEYAKITYQEIYPNIDLRYYGNGEDLKYDYILKAGADVNTIRMKFDGIKGVIVNRKGELEISTDWGIVLEKRPYSYQVVNGEKREVDIRYQVLNKTTFGFRIYGSYHPGVAIVIDPVVLKYATFVGTGDVRNHQYPFDIAVDKNRNVYVTGYSVEDFPTTPGAYNTNLTNDGSSTDIFLFKLDPTGKKLIYSTYIGGNSGEIGYSVDVNEQGEAFVCGSTSSKDFPTTTGTFQPNFVFSGGFVLRMNAAGNKLSYSTYLGSVVCRDLDVNDANEAVVVGYTDKVNIKGSTGAYQENKKSFSDVVVAKFTDSGALKYLTFVGGNGYDEAYSVAMNNQGEACVTGTTSSTDFPVSLNALLSQKQGVRNPFIVRLNEDGTQLLAGTYLGGSISNPSQAIPGGVGKGQAITVNISGDIFVSGTTSAIDFITTPGVYNRVINVGNTVFVAKLNAGLSQLMYATFLGQATEASGIAVSSIDEVFVTGSTTDAGFPVTTACNNYRQFHGVEDVFIARLSSDASTLQYSALFGGSEHDYGGISARVSIAIKEEQPCKEVEAFVTFSSHSSDLVGTSGSYQPDHKGEGTDETFVLNLKPVIEPDFKFSPPQCNTPIQFTDLTKGNCIKKWSIPNWAPGDWVWHFGDGTTSTEQNPKHTYANAGKYTVKLVVGCPHDSIEKIIDIPNPFTPFDLGPDIISCAGSLGNIQLDAKNQGAGISYLWSTNATTQSIQVNQPATYWVKISDGNCVMSDTIKIVVEQQPEIKIRDTSLCALPGAEVTLDAQNPGASYSWSTGATTQQIKITSSGSYSLAVDKNGCKNTGNAKVTFVSAPVITLINDTTVCGNVNITLDAGNPGANYSWNHGATDQQITIQAPDKYMVTVTLPGGCKAKDSVTIQSRTLPIIALRDTIICDRPGNMIILDAQNPGASYYWSTGANTQAITVSDQGKYYVTVVRDGCQASDTAIVEKIAKPEVQLTDIKQCGTTPVLLDAKNSGAVYEWNTGAHTQTILAIDPGTYEVTVSFGDCKANGSVKVDHLPIPVVRLPADTFICTTNSLKLNAGNPQGIYEWSTGATDQIITVDKDGLYSVKVMNEYGCIDEDTISIRYHQPIQLGPDQDLCGQEKINLSAAFIPGVSYSWSTGETTAQIEVHQGGAYVLSASKDGCTSIDTVIVSGEFGTPLLYIPNTFSPNKDGLNETFKPVGSEVTSFRMNIFNRWGELYFQTNDLEKGWDGRYNGTLVQEDVYIYVVEYNVRCSEISSSIRKWGHVTVLR